jgi:hypothetical protein
MGGGGMSNVPPAIREKPNDTLELMRDVDYFLTQVVQRMERLEEIAVSGRVRSFCQQAAAWLRRFRGLLRQEADRERRRRKLEARGRA